MYLCCKQLQTRFGMSFAYSFAILFLRITLEQWMMVFIFRSVAQRSSERENLHREIEQTWRIAKELSDMIVYCRAVTFNQERLLRHGRCPNEMSSFPETKGEKLILNEWKFFIWYHQVPTLILLDTDNILNILTFCFK